MAGLSPSSRICRGIKPFRRQSFPLNELVRRYSSKIEKEETKMISLPATADVVIIGGTTWHTAGLVWRLRPSDVEIQLLGHTHKILSSLEAETGLDPGWINNGGLFIANNKERLEEYKRLHTLGKVLNIPSYLLDPAETKKLYPLMNVQDVYGTLYSPLDGTIDPHGLCTALSRHATKLGAKIVEKCPVTNILTKETDFGNKQVHAVVTDNGIVQTSCIINCTGAWANYISNMVGVHTPLVAMKHAYVVTEKIPGIEKMPNVRDHDQSIYLKLQGDALQVGGYEVDPVFINQIEKDFAFGLYELDYDVFGVHIQGAVNRLPCLEKSGIKSTVCGPESFTPDHKPIMGEDPRVRGFFHGVGFNSAGMMLGGGCGDQLAKWVVHGRPELDMYGYDIRRFCPEVSKDNVWVNERSHEAYAKNYSMVFPHDEPLAGRNMKKDPLYQVLLEAGCVYQERFGWERPGWFTHHQPSPPLQYDWYGAYDHKIHETDIYKDHLQLDYTFDHPGIQDNIRHECLATRTTAGVFNMSYFGKFYLTGPDAQAAANWIFTGNMDCPPGRTVYTCMLNKMAGIEADLTVSVLESGEGGSVDPKFTGTGFYIAAAGGAAYQNLSHIQKTVQDAGFDVNITDKSREMGMLSIQGPRSRDILSRLTSEPLDNLSFPFSTHKMITVAGHRVRAMRVSFVGELGWELHIPSSSCIPVYQAIMEAGQPAGIVNAGYRALDSLSIEKGYPHWHQELRLDDNPAEAGLLFTCKLKTNQQFLGRDKLQEIITAGPRKKKVCLSVKDSVCLVGLEGVLRNGEYVGHVRRADHAFYLEQEIAYAYIENKNEKITAAWLQDGEYQIESRGAVYPATLHIKSPFDPKNSRIQGEYGNLSESLDKLKKVELLSNFK
ncbi:sarcosine dehydrogenase, mitochondrial isoform X2 [Eurytemora carolleeae]|uniref:sarcosine dehydrogenase, mitochondrial isoform X2 n=1 Tax=Eurytemora carolleeae TaxID=1294199 RepID=UPI000C77B203|nr:sarcosine dehydrogenase, mitochondrial isoform X2 [Eurytemora carolleeae]|eukprot:XP_023344278.1 sarcosine dehydrogenase, mitochondrial-like isoform X2 [Eurytemora affinis]